MEEAMRVGILTAGGDCPGLNAAIRAVAKSLIHEQRAEVIGFEDGFLGVLERRFRPLGLLDVSGILTAGGTILGTDNRCNPFRYASRAGADVSDELIACFRDQRLDALVVIGGEGTMIVAQGLMRKGVPIVGVPKTIDNDVVGTERTIGFDTAMTIAADALSRIHTTSQSHHRVFLVETMGRHAGWNALYAGLASGADVILLPEIEFDLEVVADVCRRRERGGPRFTLISVAEGAKLGGHVAVRAKVPESAEPERLGGIAEKIASELGTRVASEVRSIVLGHTQRGGSPTAADRVLATAFGSHAAALVAAGGFGRMVALHNQRLTSVAIDEIAGRVRQVPADSPLIGAAHALGISFGNTIPAGHRGETFTRSPL
jgi:6-phosphofructokinase 1